jgi:hypothetical protein
MDGVRFGYEREVEENTAYTRAWLGSDTERRRARRLRLRTAGSARCGSREISWACGLLRPSRPVACWAEEAERLRGTGWAERPKTSEGKK